MARDLNHSVYTGEYMLNQYVKYTDTIRTLVQGGNLSVNAPIDDSCYLNYCIGDSLIVPRFIRVSNLGTGWAIESEAVRLPNNNYFLSYYPGGGTSSANANFHFYYMSNTYGNSYPELRMGMGAIAGVTPNVAICYDVATAYVVLAIQCRMAQYTTTEVSGHTVYTFSSIQNRYVDEVLAEPDSYWENHACLCMWANCYVGNETTRNTIRGVGVSSVFGDKPFSTTLANNDTYGNQYVDDPEILQSVNRCAGSWDCLYQGIYTPSVQVRSQEVPGGHNAVCFSGACNPTFFDIVFTGYSVSQCTIGSAIFTKLKFQSAFNAYNCTGLLYTGNGTDATTGDPLINPNVRQGKKGEDGRTDPNNTADTKGGGLATDPEKMYLDTGFNGNDDIDPNNYVDETPLEKPGLTALGVFNRTFAMNYTNLSAFADWVWNADDNIFDQIVEGLKMLGENPLNGVIDVRLYPFDVGQLINSGGAEYIKLGRITSDVQGIKVSGTDNAIINLGSCTFTKHFKSYLDYSPYTEARLFIPYCGVIPIDTVEFMGHELSAKMIVDLVTGACTVLLYKDQIITYTAQGVCGVSIPFTGTDSAAYAQSVLGSVFNSGVSLVGAKTISGALDSVGGIMQGLATPTQYVQGGSPSPSCGNWAPQYAYLIIDRPKPIPPDDYGHCVGYACEIYDNLNNFSGFTVVDNPDLSGIGATETEKEEIKRLLQEGVYL